MSVCNCFHDEQNFLHERGVCYGTKEKEPCACGGDEAKCDFYDYVRSRAKKPLTNYDLLIRLSLEELAKLLATIPLLWKPPTYTIGGICIDDGVRTEKEWLKWLKQEADNGQN